MKLKLYTDYKGLCTPVGERFVASGRQNDYWVYEIELEHSCVASKANEYSTLLVVVMPSGIEDIIFERIEQLTSNLLKIQLGIKENAEDDSRI